MCVFILFMGFSRGIKFEDRLSAFTSSQVKLAYESNGWQGVADLVGLSHLRKEHYPLVRSYTGIDVKQKSIEISLNERLKRHSDSEILEALHNGRKELSKLLGYINIHTDKYLKICSIYGVDPKEVKKSVLSKQQLLRSDRYSNLNDELLRCHCSLVDELPTGQLFDSRLRVRCNICGCEYSFHYTGKGTLCPKCSLDSSMRSNREVWFEHQLDLRGIKHEHRHHILPNNMGDIDVFLPDFNIGFEFNGYWWHCIRPGSHITPDYHLRKSTAARQLGIALYHIWEDVSDKFIINFLDKLIHKSPKIYARKCIITSDKSLCSKFISEHHRHGNSVQATEYLGLIYEGKVVSAMSFQYRSNHWENTRYATGDLTVIGGFSKLLKSAMYRMQELRPNCHELWTYCDADLTPIPENSVYSRAGFILIGNSGCEMRYYDRHKVWSRQHFQKCKLSSLGLLVNPEWTEQQNLQANNIFPVYNSGNWKFILRF